MRKITILLAIASTLTGSFDGEAHAQQRTRTLNDYCQTAYNERFVPQPAPKAFVLGDDGSCWRSGRAATLNEAQRDALKRCRKSGAGDCWVVEAVMGRKGK